MPVAVPAVCSPQDMCTWEVVVAVVTVAVADVGRSGRLEVEVGAVVVVVVVKHRQST